MCSQRDLLNHTSNPQLVTSLSIETKDRKDHAPFNQSTKEKTRELCKCTVHSRVYWVILGLLSKIYICIFHSGHEMVDF
jgi:hypothetical protein